MRIRLCEECFHVLTFVIALMPDLDKWQHGSVPIVLERSLADVQYSAHVPIVQQIRQFGLRTEMFSHTKSQLFDALFQFPPSGGIDGCKCTHSFPFIVLFLSQQDFSRRKSRRNTHFPSQICTFASGKRECSLDIQNNMPQCTPFISKSLPIHLLQNGNTLLSNEIVR